MVSSFIGSTFCWGQRENSSAGEWINYAVSNVDNMRSKVKYNDNNWGKPFLQSHGVETFMARNMCEENVYQTKTSTLEWLREERVLFPMDNIYVCLFVSADFPNIVYIYQLIRVLFLLSYLCESSPPLVSVCTCMLVQGLAMELKSAFYLSSCLSFLSAGITDMNHQTWL